MIRCFYKNNPLITKETAISSRKKLIILMKKLRILGIILLK